MPNSVSLTCPNLQILGKTQTEVFPISRFLVNHLYKKIVITAESVMILIWNLDQSINLQRETKATSKKIDDDVMSAKCDVIVNWQWTIWSNPEAGFQTHRNHIFMTSSRWTGGWEGKKWYKFRRKWMVTARFGEGEGIHRNWMSTAIISISVIRVQTVFQTSVWFCYKCSRQTGVWFWRKLGLGQHFGFLFSITIFCKKRGWGWRGWLVA